MPFYDVNHSLPLTDAQRESLAKAITAIHVKAFATPAMFVNVRFVYADPAESSSNFFIGGERQQKTPNAVLAQVRTSAARTKADFDQVGQEIEDAWYQAVGGGSQPEGEHPYLAEKPEARLHAIGFFPIVAAREAGFTIPTAGEEKEWFQQQLPVFKKLAEHGDAGFIKLLEEVQKKSAPTA